MDAEQAIPAILIVDDEEDIARLLEEVLQDRPEGQDMVDPLGPQQGDALGAWRFLRG